MTIKQFNHGNLVERRVHDHHGTNTTRSQNGWEEEWFQNNWAAGEFMGPKGPAPDRRQQPEAPPYLRYISRRHGHKIQPPYISWYMNLIYGRYYVSCQGAVYNRAVFFLLVVPTPAGSFLLVINTSRNMVKEAFLQHVLCKYMSRTPVCARSWYAVMGIRATIFFFFFNLRLLFLLWLRYVS